MGSGCLNLEFFLQVTQEEHLGWTQEVPTVLKGKYRKVVDEKLAASARHLFGYSSLMA
jgi:hypothetical protein